MLHRRERALGVALATLLLAGCVPSLPLAGPGRDALQEISSIIGGECFRLDEIGGEVAVNLTEAVPCTEEHEVEIIRTVVVPARLATLSSAEAAELSMPGGDVYEYAMPLCIEALAAWTGLTERIGGLRGLDGDVGLWPGLSGMLGLIQVPAALWDEHPAVFCAFEPTDELGQVVVVTSATPDEPVVAMYGQPDAPSELGLCLIYDKAGASLVRCTEPHHAEVLFEFDAELMFGTEWVAAVDRAQPSDAAWAEMDEVCAIAAPAVFGAERTRGDLTIQADLLGGLWSRSKLASDTAYVNAYPVSCVAIVTDQAMMLNGTVWGLGDSPAELVPQ